MPFRAGTVSWVKLDNAAGTPTDLNAYIDDFSVPYSTEMLEVTAFGTAAKTYIPGLQGGDTISVKGPYDATVFSHFGSLIAAQAAGTASHSFLWGPGGSVSGQAKVTGEFLVAALELPSTVAGRVEYSATLQITGAVTYATW